MKCKEFNNFYICQIIHKIWYAFQSLAWSTICFVISLSRRELVMIKWINQQSNISTSESLKVIIFLWSKHRHYIDSCKTLNLEFIGSFILISFKTAIGTLVYVPNYCFYILKVYKCGWNLSIIICTYVIISTIDSKGKIVQDSLQMLFQMLFTHIAPYPKVIHGTL